MLLHKQWGLGCMEDQVDFIISDILKNRLYYALQYSGSYESYGTGHTLGSK